MLLAASAAAGGEVEAVPGAVDAAIARVSDLSRYTEAELASAAQWVAVFDDPGGAAAPAGARLKGAVRGVPGAFVYEFDPGRRGSRAVRALREQVGAGQFFPLIARQMLPRGTVPTGGVPGTDRAAGTGGGAAGLSEVVATASVAAGNPQADPLFGRQWHLLNTGQRGGTPGADANVTPAWADGVLGDGVVIAVVDDALQYTHPDLAPNYDAALSYDFNFNDPDPAPGRNAEDNHGTAVAGIAAASGGNGVGVSGAAPAATLAGLRLISAAVTDATEADALSYRRADIDVYNSSWGPADDGRNLQAPGPLTLAALADNVRAGRGGLGNVYTWAGGNGGADGDDVNYDGYANSRYVIPVAAITDAGTRAWYSEPGAPLLVSAYSSGGSAGVTTTDRGGAAGYSAGDYYDSFSGTSASAPLAAGVVALVLDANPALGWRDVQHVLVRSARQNDPLDPDWTTNGAGLHVNHTYGFGAVDAAAAVDLAAAWTPVGPEVSVTSGVVSVDRAIPEDAAGVTSAVTVPTGLSVEKVEVVFDAAHTHRGDLEVVLTSPAGTRSVLAAEHDDPGDDYASWVFSSARHWGENSAGEWTLTVADRATGEVGTFGSWRLNVHGTFDGAGPRVADATPAGEVFGPQAAAVFTFDRPMDPATFNPAADVQHFTGPGGADLRSQITGATWLDGNRTLRLAFTPRTALGVYSIALGPQILAAGVPMDQDGDGTAGEAAGDGYADSFTIAAPRVTSARPLGGGTQPLAGFEFAFSQPMDPAGFTAAADVVRLVAPGGANLKPDVTGHAWLNGNTTLRLDIKPQDGHGDYAVTIGPGVVSAAAAGGLPMDQDRDFTAGETSPAGDDQFTATASVVQWFGPDPFGYRASPAPLEPIDLVPGAPGVVSLLDGFDNALAVPLGTNTFRFYDQVFTGAAGLYVSTNGLITFTAPNLTYFNADLSASPRRPAIAPLWDDWETNAGPDDRVLYRFDDLGGAPGPERLVVEWNQVPHFDGSAADPVTFQAVLRLNTGAAPGEILFNYPDLAAGTAALSNGGSATVGIKDEGNTNPRRLLVSYENANSPFVATGRAVRITAAAGGGVPRVAGRHVFYNASSYDGNNPAPGAADDAAIAPGKAPLLPGATATAANVTSYNKGINGVMVDIAGLPAGAEQSLTADDFLFRTGNDAGPYAWAAAAATPPAVAVRRGAGANGSDRVTLTWPDGAIRNTWLQVTVKANQHTGLGAPDVFYFGNAIGETFDTPGGVRVDSRDVTRTRNAQSKPTTAAGLYDHNRDGRVNAQDLTLARNNQPFTLARLTAPVVPPAAPAGATGASGAAAPESAPTSATGGAAARTDKSRRATAFVRGG